MSPRDTYTYCDYCKREGSDYKNYKCTHCGAIGCYREGCPNRNWTSNVWVGDTCWACGQHDCVTPRDSTLLGAVAADTAKRDAVLGRMRDYRCSGPPEPATPPSFLYRLVHPFHRTGGRLRGFNISSNGATAERIQSLLGRMGCRVDAVDTSDNMVVIEFAFPEDDGLCLAFLTDRLRDGSYFRCNIAARVGLELPPDWINELNRYSKFLKFYNVQNNSLFVEFAFQLVDLPDNSIFANLVIFHGSIMRLISNGFVYEGMKEAAVVPGSPQRQSEASDTAVADRVLSDRRARAVIRRRGLLSRQNYPGKGGAPWTAEDEDHAWKIGVVHAYALEKFNPPSQAAYRGVYLSGYKETTDDEGLNNEYPDS